MFNMGARAGFNERKNASSYFSMTGYSFLYEERMFELRMANLKDHYVKQHSKFTCS